MDTYTGRAKNQGLTSLKRREKLDFREAKCEICVGTFNYLVSVYDQLWAINNTYLLHCSIRPTQSDL